MSISAWALSKALSPIKALARRMHSLSEMKQIRLKNKILKIDSCYNCECRMPFEDAGESYCNFNSEIFFDSMFDSKEPQDNSIDLRCPLEDVE